jgi:hypothetical protein
MPSAPNTTLPWRSLPLSVASMPAKPSGGWALFVLDAEEIYALAKEMA